MIKSIISAFPRLALWLLLNASPLWSCGCSGATLDDSEARDQFVYSKNDLGAVYTPQFTTLKLWAPTAKSVSVVLFADLTNASSALIPMSRDPDGIWTATLSGDQDGKYYLYEITHQVAGAGKSRVQVNDPYAYGCSRDYILHRGRKWEESNGTAGFVLV